MCCDKKKLVLADCEETEIQSFVRGLCQEGEWDYQVKSHVSNWKRTGKISELKRYAKYFGVGFLYFLKRNQYSVIIGWQQFYTLILVFFCELFHVRKKTIIIAGNYTYKQKNGKIGEIYYWFIRKCMSEKYLDYIHVPSAAYADQVSQEFAYPRERIIVATFGIDDEYDHFVTLAPPVGYAKESYALALGRSNRDFDFLIRAWERLEYPLAIVSDTYKGDTDNPYIHILRNVDVEESKSWIANCAVMLIPIDDGTICSGDTVLLTSMSAGRKIIVSAPSTLSEMYVIDGQNALLAPKEETVFVEKVKEVLYSETYSKLGEQARICFLHQYSRKSLGEKFAKFLQEKSYRR